MTRRDAIKLAIAGALSPLLSLLPEREARKLPRPVETGYGVASPCEEGGWYDPYGELGVCVNGKVGCPGCQMVCVRHPITGELRMSQDEVRECNRKLRAAPRTEGGR